MQKKYTPEARRLIRKLSPDVKKPLRALTDEVAADPSIGKELKDKLEGFRSARYSHYRVIYEFDQESNSVLIHYVGQRKSVYELFERFLTQSIGVPEN